MPVDKEKAVRIALKAGLGLPDAQALAALADDEEHAAALASDFTREKREEAERDETRRIADAVEGW